MKTILKTKRLLLREFDPSDAEEMYELNSDPEVIRYTGDPPFDSAEHAHRFISNYEDYVKNGYGRWAVIEKASGKFIGWCGLKLSEQNQVDLGFRFFKQYWGKGYATESARACLEYGFNVLKLDDIMGRAARANPASIAVLQKIGLSYWKDDDCKGIEDSVYYRLKRSDYIESIQHIR